MPTELRGLPAASPAAFLAACGLMRVLGQDLGLPVRLGWHQGYAVLTGIEPDALLQALVEHIQGRHLALEFNWSATTRKVSPERFRQTCTQAAEAGDERALGFMAGWGCDAVLRPDAADPSQLYITPTALDLTSGQQALIKNLQDLAKRLQAPAVAKEAFTIACFGGDYANDQSAFGLDPATQRRRATGYESPTGKKPSAKPGWVWLFAESIPMHPVLPQSDGRATTAGVSKGYFWPIWQGWLNWQELTALRALPQAMLTELTGVAEIWHARKVVNGKYGTLLPAVRIPLANAATSQAATLASVTSLAP